MNPPIAPRTNPWGALLADRTLMLLAAAMPILTLATNTAISDSLLLVNWPTIATLAGLLLLTKGIELSGLLHRIARHLLLRMHSERQLALLLVIAAELLSTVLTNDVALFILIPLTLGLHGMTRTLPTVRLVVFQALAVNAGSTLTPIGNPQNLFLWQLSGTGFYPFVQVMAPLALLLSVLLLAMTLLSFSPRSVDVEEDLKPPALRARPAWASLVLFPVFLILVEHRLAAWALALVGMSFLAADRSVPARCDWNLIVIFVLMFIDLKLLAQLESVQRLLLSTDWSAYASAIIASQLISNVPATILLSGFHNDWRALAWGANLGGFGWMLGSLANLIALRMLNMNRSWLVFHLYSIPFLIVAATLSSALLRP